MVQDLTLPTEPQDQGNLDLAPQDSEFAGEADFQHSFILTINGINYPATGWETVAAARFVEKRYPDGFNGGMGAFLDSQAVRPGQIYTCVNLDPTTFPYIRMRKGERDETILTLTGSDADNAAYGFVEEKTGVEYLYIVNKDRSFKIDLGASGAATPALEATTQPAGFASGVAGRPVRFEGVWYVPLGDGVNARKLTAVGVGDQTNDTWADVGVKALHFATMMNEGVAEIWRAHTTNLIDGSADGTTFGADFEVGDTSYAITDLLSVSGELFVSKPDRPWRFDSQGNSVPIMEFVNATADFLPAAQGFDGANSGAHGPYAYWAHATGLWRIIGDSATPIDPFSQRNWSGIALDALVPSYPTGWFGFAAWGRWAYAVNASDGVYAGWIEDDGIVTWMGNILSANGTSWTAKMRIGIVTTSTNPILWVLDDNDQFAVFDLELDGSIRKILTAGSNRDRGGDNEQAQIWLPSTDMGEPEKQKQMRMSWLTVDNNGSANLDIEMRVHRDRAATSTQIGSAITSSDGDGTFEFVFTPGGSDTFTEAMLAIRFDSNQAGAFAPGPAGPRIRSCGMRAAMPHVYRATIPLDAEGLRGYSLGVKDALKKLRDLKSSEGVTIREPGFNGTFTGYILDVQETAKVSAGGRVDYVAEVLIQRWIL